MGLHVEVAGVIRAWVALHKWFGSVSFANLFELAAEIAERGYLMQSVVQQTWANGAPNLEGQGSFLAMGTASWVSELFCFLAAAHALRSIGASGSITEVRSTTRCR